MANPTTQLELTMSRELHANTETDTMQRSRFRTDTLIAAWYDDEPSEPDQAIRDVLTDLVHLADARGVDLHHALDRAVRMADEERADWGLGKVQR